MCKLGWTTSPGGVYYAVVGEKCVRKTGQRQTYLQFPQPVSCQPQYRGSWSRPDGPLSSRHHRGDNGKKVAGKPILLSPVLSVATTNQ